MARVGFILVIVFVAVTLGFWLKGRIVRPTSSPATVPTEDRFSKLKKQIAEQEIESAQAVAKYTPTSNARIDDLGLPVADLLRQLPGVVQVEFSVAPKNPTTRIVHLRDWHLVPKELYAIDMKHARQRELTDEEIDRLHQELFLEVELVQFEQMAVLRCLIKHHGLKRVFAEGFSPNELAAYREKIAVLRSMEQEKVPQVRMQLDAVRKLLEGATGERSGIEIRPQPDRRASWTRTTPARLIGRELSATQQRPCQAFSTFELQARATAVRVCLEDRRASPTRGASMAVFVLAYVRVLGLLQEWGKGKKGAIQQQIDFFESLPGEAKSRLEDGQYPPYRFVRAASRAGGVPVETCKNWLLAFLHWRSKSLNLKDPKPEVQS